jgi:hypothetical protein
VNKIDRLTLLRSTYILHTLVIFTHGRQDCKVYSSKGTCI